MLACSGLPEVYHGGDTNKVDSSKDKQMIVSSKDALARLNSSSNLVNKLRSLNGLSSVRNPNSNDSGKRKNAMDLFKPSTATEEKVKEIKNILPEKSSEKLSPTFEPKLGNLNLSNPFRSSEVTKFNPKPTVEEPDILVVEPEVMPARVSVDEILDNVDTKIKLQSAHNDSLDLLVNAVKLLGTKLDDVKPDKLPSIISAAAKTVEGIRRERLEINKSQKDRQVHFHFYEPKRKTIADLGEALEV
jgi:hypothetical protein